MNKVILLGRVVADPEVRYTQGNNPSAVARYRLAVDRRYQREGEPDADFIPCVAFGKAGEFAGKYLHKGIKILLTGRIQTGSYTNRYGQKVYTTDVIVEEQEFVESKSASGSKENDYYTGRMVNPSNGFMDIPDGVDDQGLPFN